MEIHDAVISTDMALLLYKQITNNILKLSKKFSNNEITYMVNNYLHKFDNVEIDVLEDVT